MNFRDIPLRRRSALAAVSAFTSGMAIGTVLGSNGPEDSGCKTEVDMIVGGDRVAGTVCVDVDAPNVYVTYQTKSPWYLTESHLAVGDDLDEYEEEGWVNPRGQPRPGRFPLGETHDPPVEEASFTIPFDALGDFSWPVVIAAHALVTDELDGTTREESAWAAGERFVERGSWATYFEFDGGVAEIVGVGETAAGG